MSAGALAGLALALAPAAALAVRGGPHGGPPLDPAPAASPRGHFRSWTGTPSEVAGGIAYSHREVIVTDSPFDDHGGDTFDNTDPGEFVTGPLQGANAAEGSAGSATGGANGDYRYPPGQVYGRNAADIVEVRVAADPHAWYLLVRLNMLRDPGLTAIVARVGHHELLVHGRRAVLDGHRVAVVADRRQALFEVRVPRAVYDPGHAKRRVFIAAGLWDPASHAWYRPARALSPYFDLAYVPGEGMDSYWRDKKQSADIASGHLARDAFTVDFAALARGGCPAGGGCPSYTGPRRGLFSRVFRSGQPLGRGVTLQTRYGQATGDSPPNLYRSPYQAYAIYVPRHPTGAMVLLLHFLGGNYMSYSLTSMPKLAAWAEKLGVIVVMPLARGEGGWYEGEAEKDVFEVWRDVAQHYRVDPNRVYLAGMSMGGFGTWRLGQLYPDLFARGIIWSGPVVPDTFWFYPAPPVPPSCGPHQPSDCGYNLVDLFGNTSNLPLLVLHGGADELVPSTGAEHWMASYGATAGATYRYLFYPLRRHETSYPGSTASWVEDWLGGLPRRQTNPVRVSYRVMRKLFQPGFGITYSRAYWVQGLALARGVATGSILASRATVPDYAQVLPVRYGADGLGPYRLSGQNVTPAQPLANTVRLRLTGFSHAALDIHRMGWSLARRQHVLGRTDRPIQLVLDGDPGAGSVRGAAFRRTASGLVLKLEAGRFDVTVRPRAPVRR